MKVFILALIVLASANNNAPANVYIPYKPCSSGDDCYSNNIWGVACLQGPQDESGFCGCITNADCGGSPNFCVNGLCNVELCSSDC